MDSCSTTSVARAIGSYPLSERGGGGVSGKSGIATYKLNAMLLLPADLAGGPSDRLTSYHTNDLRPWRNYGAKLFSASRALYHLLLRAWRLSLIAPGQDLTRENAIQQYIALRMRAEDIRVMNLLYYGIRYKRIVVSSHAQRRLLRDLRDLMDTGERLSYLLYANLLDLNGQNIFDSLLLLFPYDPGMIRVARQHFEQLTSMLKQLRAMTSLPARQKLAARLQIDQLIDGNRRQLDEAVMQFVRHENR
jgi:hypothetical protein